MGKIFIGKKGQVTDFLGGLQRGISQFLQTAPKPILYLLFLAILLLIGSLMGFVLNLTGQYCDTAGNEYSVPFLQVSDNFRLLINMPSNDELDTTTIDPNDAGFNYETVVDCSYYVLDGVIRYSNGTLVNISDQYLFHDTGRCTNCDEEVVLITNTLQNERYCFSDILYPKPYENRSLAGKLFCGNFLGSCTIPEGYYYDRSQNLFICDDPLCLVNGSESSVGQRWNLLLRDVGANLREPSVYGDRDYRNAVSVECDAGDVKPHLRFFGIEIFDYKLWIFLFILGVLIWTVINFKR